MTGTGVVSHDEVLEIDRPVGHAFDVVARHCVENHPRWESEVVEVRPVSEGPMRLGFESVMVRREMGRTSEVPTRCTAYDDDRLVAFEHAAGPMAFRISFTFTPIGADRSRIDVHVEAEPHGAFRLMTPLLRRRMPRTSARIGAQMVEVVEETPTYQTS